MDLLCDPPRSSTRKKYLVSGSHVAESSSIFDYVYVVVVCLIDEQKGIDVAHRGKLGTFLVIRHLSSKLLRNVRHGQPLDHAIQVRRCLQHARAESVISNANLHVPQSPEQIQHRANDWGLKDSSPPTLAPPRSPQQSRLFSANSPTRTSKSTINSFVRYGCAVRFQAHDGGFLLVDNDGTLRKTSDKLRNDPRTVVTLFASDSFTIGTTSKCLRSGDPVFLVQGAASVYTDHQAIHADSQRSANHRASDRRGARPQEYQYRDQPGDTKTEATNVWSIQKVVSPSAIGGRPDGKPTLASLNDEYFPDGAIVEILQNNQVVCYEPETPATARGDAAETHGQDLVGMNTSSDERGSVVDFPTSFSSDIWLMERSPLGTVAPMLPSILRAKQMSSWKIQRVDFGRSPKRTDRTASRRMTQTPTKQQIANAVTPATTTSRPNNPDEPSDGPYTPGQFNKELEEKLNRAARIIVKFLRRVCLNESAEKRINAFVHRRLHQQHRLQPQNDIPDLTIDQQIRMLQCYKPTVYSSGSVLVPPLNIAPQKYAAITRLQRNKLRSRQEKGGRISHEVAFLSEGSDFEKFRLSEITQLRSPAAQPSSRPVTSNTRCLSRRHRGSEQRHHVQMIMAKGSEPPLHYGTPSWSSNNLPAISKF